MDKNGLSLELNMFSTDDYREQASMKFNLNNCVKST